MLLGSRAASRVAFAHPLPGMMHRRTHEAKPPFQRHWFSLPDVVRAV
jgi:hypothetical protein